MALRTIRTSALEDIFISNAGKKNISFSRLFHNALVQYIQSGEYKKDFNYMDTFVIHLEKIKKKEAYDQILKFKLASIHAHKNFGLLVMNVLAGAKTKKEVLEFIDLLKEISIEVYQDKMLSGMIGKLKKELKSKKEFDRVKQEASMWVVDMATKDEKKIISYEKRLRKKKK